MRQEWWEPKEGEGASPLGGTRAREDLGWVTDGASPAGHPFFFFSPSYPGPSYLVEKMLETHADFLTGISNRC